MNKLLLTSALVAAFGAAALAPQTARAAQNSSPDGTITITGVVAANTCTVNTNGSGTNNAPVTLPTVYTDSLAASGETTGDKQFNISVSGCDSNLSTVSAYWSGSNINSSDRLNNTLTTNNAKNVDVQLLNSDDSTAIALNSAQGQQASEVVNLASGAATLNYYARYYATGAATPGKVSTSVDFTLVYE